MERRTFSRGILEMRAAEGDVPVIAGYAAVFNVASEEMGWGLTEVIAPGAFSKTLQERDVLALWNHNTDMVMGSTRGGALTLAEDTHGLSFELRGPFDGFDSQVAALRRGDVQGVSFGFRSIRDSYDYEGEGRDETVTRTIKEVELFEVSPTPFPAYPQTDVVVRTAHAAAVALDRPDIFWAATRSAGVDAAELRGMNLEPIELLPLEGPVSNDSVRLRRTLLALEHPTR